MQCRNVVLCCLLSVVCVARGEGAPVSLADALAESDAAATRYVASGDTRELDAALAALARAERSAPGSYAVARQAVALALARGQGRDALHGAQALATRNPDDVQAWALLIDAEFALDRLADAEAHAQTLLDLRPDEPLGLAAAARVRAHAGDRDGAVEALSAALVRLPADQGARRAAWLAELAALYRADGRGADACAAARAAERAWPGHRAARAALVRCDALAATPAVPR